MHEPLRVVAIQEARSKLEEHWQPQRRVKLLPLDEAGGMVLAKEVSSKIDLPPFDRSDYDGFAVRAADTFGAGEDDPVELFKVGEVLAGQDPEVELEYGQCAAIATGAQVPNEADAVVMVEDTTSVGEKVEIRRPVTPGENVSERGSEIKQGAKIASAGQRLSPQVHGILFACGVKDVKIFCKPKVAIISTGQELVEAGSKLGPGQIYDVNGPAIYDAVNNCGAEPSYLGIVRDSLPEIEERVREALSDHDLTIISGGSSAGAKDIVPETINGLGDPGVLVHGLAQKPGKPTFLAVIDGNPIFGLPGYPVSALMVFDQLVAPYLRFLSAAPEVGRKRIRARLVKKVLSARGRRELVPVSLAEGDYLLAHPLRKGSGAITSLANADGYIVISIDQEIVEEGAEVTVNLFGGSELA